jgi:hypothetical protein
MAQYLGGLLWLLMAVLVIVAWRIRKTRSPGPGAAGALQELLDRDKRAAVEIIAEGRAGQRDAEDRDGNLPDLENPRR